MSQNSYPRWWKTTVIANDTEWTPVVAPENMAYIALRCDASALLYRTNVDDPLSEDSLPAGFQDGVTAGLPERLFNWPSVNRSRFIKGEAACYVRLPNGTPTASVHVTWVL
jgi:hypothetical protein